LFSLRSKDITNDKSVQKKPTLIPDAITFDYFERNIVRLFPYFLPELLHVKIESKYFLEHTFCLLSAVSRHENVKM